MGLQVWLPLNGDLNNQGVSTNTFSGNPTFSENGKIGKCLSSGTISSYNSDVPTNLMSTSKYTMCSWIKTTSANVWAWAMSSGSGTTRGLWITNTGRPQFAYSGSGAFNGNAIINDNKWHHVLITCDGVNSKEYVDGIYCGESSSTRIDQAASNAINLYSTSTCSINDFRLYDHVLSLLEIKLLSQALVLHYPLNNQYEGSFSNKYSSPYSDGECSSSSWTKTELLNERGWNYKLTYTGTGSNYWPHCEVPAYSFTSGQTYYYSVKVRCNKWTSGNLYLRASRSSNDWVTRSVVVCSSSLADGKWHEYYTYQTVGDTYDRSGTTVTCNPVLEFYTSNLNGDGTVYDMDFDLRDIQVVESDTYVPFIHNDYKSTTVSDTSGNGYNGVKYGGVYVNPDSPRNNSSTCIKNANSYISVSDLITTGFGDSYSISWWGKVSSFSGKMMWGFSDGIRLNGIYNGNLWNTGDGSQNPIYEPGTTTQITIPSVNQWHHYVMTGDGTVNYLYVDGVLYGQSKTYKSISGTSIYINGWSKNSYSQADLYMSDFRIYATALSAEDVARLYNTPISLANNGVLFTYGELQEG